MNARPRQEGIRSLSRLVRSARTIGLDGGVAQQGNYRKSGFEFAYNNIRYGGVAAGLRAPSENVPLSNVPFDLIEQDDATVFPAARRAFLRTWIAAPGHVYFISQVGD